MTARHSGVGADRAPHYVMKLLARWQSGVETLSGYTLPKLRLGLAFSVSDAFTDVQLRRSKRYDRNLNHVWQLPYLPLSSQPRRG